MVINNYYRQEWAPAGIDPNILEKTIGTGLEPQGQQAFQKLIEHDDISQVTRDDVAAMLAYLEFQRVRVPRQASQAAELMRTVLLERMPRELAELVLSGRIAIESTDAFRFHMMKIQWGNLLPWLARMQWLVIEAPPETSFLTSDNPVSFYNGHFPPPAEAGLGLIGTMVLFPLCSRKLLMLRHPEAASQAGTISAHTMAPAPDVNSDQTSLTYGSVWPAEQVRYLNEAILALSDQLVAGESKEALEACIGEPLRGH